ncbi:MAG: hypothetical protein LBK95_16925 [Bifidobacteriaceae bacterium]|jgi:uncharacterized protein (UPF0254 family)|nr:hypothetical protein [Bifidobacteriaceae bacterium]
MAPKRLPTAKGGFGEARNRRLVAERYLEVADLVAEEAGATINVAIGLAVLAGIAGGDAICLAALGERYAGPDHVVAADLLTRVDAKLGSRLRELLGLKAASHYGSRMLTSKDRSRALRHAGALVAEARSRTI